MPEVRLSGARRLLVLAGRLLPPAVLARKGTAMNEKRERVADVAEDKGPAKKADG